MDTQKSSEKLTMLNPEEGTRPIPENGTIADLQVKVIELSNQIDRMNALLIRHDHQLNPPIAPTTYNPQNITDRKYQMSEDDAWKKVKTEQASWGNNTDSTTIPPNTDEATPPQPMQPAISAEAKNDPDAIAAKIVNSLPPVRDVVAKIVSETK
jgi:hypothetical protein